MSEKSNASIQSSVAEVSEHTGKPKSPATPFLVSWFTLIVVWGIGGGLVGLLPRMNFDEGHITAASFPWLPLVIVVIAALMWYVSELRHSYGIPMLIIVAVLAAGLSALIALLMPSVLLYNMVLVGLILGFVLGLVFALAGLQGGLGFALGSALGLFIIVAAIAVPFILIVGAIGLARGQDLALLGILIAIPAGSLLSALIGGTFGALRQIVDPEEFPPGVEPTQ